MKQEDIIKFKKSQRLRWAAHVMRMENTRTASKITEWTPYYELYNEECRALFVI